MRKIVIMALVLAASAISISASAQNKKAKKMAEVFEVAEKPVVLASARDTLSYTTGMAATRGLMEYLQQQLGVDTMFMADFKRGFDEAIQRGTDPKYVAYNAGVQVAQQVQKQILPHAVAQYENTPDSLDTNLFIKGFLAGATGDASIFVVEKADAYQRAHAEEAKRIQNAAAIEENTKWLEENAKKEGVVTLPSGLQYKVLVEGKGAVAEKSDNVTVRYEGKMIDGTVFDSSYKRSPNTTTFKPSQVIKGWTEALCMMPEGSKWELYIPQELAYGERTAGKIKPYSTLIFTVEVVEVKKQ